VDSGISWKLTGQNVNPICSASESTSAIASTRSVRGPMARGAACSSGTRKGIVATGS
jgi:hypothetical protein